MRNKSLVLLIISVLFSASCQSAASQKPDASQQSEWKPASFQGVQLGKTSLQDAEKIFGKKLRQRTLKYGNEPEIQNEYEVKLFDKWDGRLTLVTDINTNKGIVSSATFFPKNITKSDVVGFFGSDFIVSHYRTDECVNAESVPIIEDKNGNIETVEYRNKGIAVFFMPDEKMVDSIIFVSKPLGKQKSDIGCKPDENNANNLP